MEDDDGGGKKKTGARSKAYMDRARVMDKEGAAAGLEESKFEALVKELDIDEATVDLLRQEFVEMDANDNGSITIEEYLVYLDLNKNNTFAVRSFQMMDIENMGRLLFRHFVSGLYGLCSMKHPQVVEFFFDVCDRNRNGFIGKNEVELMMDMNDGINASDTRLHSELSDAVKEELRRMVDKFDNEIPKDVFRRFSIRHSLMFLYPVVKVRERILGESYWLEYLEGPSIFKKFKRKVINFFKGVKEEEEAPPENGLTADEQGQLSLKARRLGAKRGDHSGFVDEERKERNRPKPVNPDEDDPTKAPSAGGSGGTRSNGGNNASVQRAIAAGIRKRREAGPTGGHAAAGDDNYDGFGELDGERGVVGNVAAAESNERRRGIGENVGGDGVGGFGSGNADMDDGGGGEGGDDGGEGGRPSSPVGAGVKPGRHPASSVILSAHAGTGADRDVDKESEEGGRQLSGLVGELDEASGSGRDRALPRVGGPHDGVDRADSGPFAGVGGPEEPEPDGESDVGLFAAAAATAAANRRASRGRTARGGARANGTDGEVVPPAAETRKPAVSPVRVGGSTAEFFSRPVPLDLKSMGAVFQLSALDKVGQAGVVRVVGAGGAGLRDPAAARGGRHSRRGAEAAPVGILAAPRPAAPVAPVVPVTEQQLGLITVGAVDYADASAAVAAASPP